MSRNSERLNGSGGAPPGSGSSAKDANASAVDLGDELSMNRIIDFLKDQQRGTYSRETEFLFEKQQMTTKINQLTA